MRRLPFKLPIVLYQIGSFFIASKKAATLLIEKFLQVFDPPFGLGNLPL